MNKKIERQAVQDSYDLFIAIWEQFVRGFEGAHVEDKGDLTILWADKPFRHWNIIFLSRLIHSVEQLRLAVDEAVAIARSKHQTGLICICSSLLDQTAYEQADSILSTVGYPNPALVTGMTAENLFPIPSTCPATLRMEQHKDFRISMELNCGVYGVPLEAAKPSTLNELLAQKAFIYVGYVADRPVCTATVLVQGNLLYLALVATDESARNQGYGEAIVRYALQKAHEATSLTKTALHASAIGNPIYARIGFRPVANFHGYMQQHD